MGGVGREVKLGLKFLVGLSCCQDNFTFDWLLAVKSVFCQGDHWSCLCVVVCKQSSCLSKPGLAHRLPYQGVHLFSLLVLEVDRGNPGPVLAFPRITFRCVMK